MALDGVSFSVAPGEIVGLLGPNGAGKTTTMRLVAGALRPTRGSVRIGGVELAWHRAELRARVGWSPESSVAYPDMTVSAYLTWIARLRAVARDEQAAAVDGAMGRAGVAAVAGRHIAALSKGYRQRVGLAQALVHDPDVLVLDEPTSGLDPRQVVETRALISSLRKDRAVLLSSHLLGEVAALCDRVVVLVDGTVRADRSVRDVLADGGTLEAAYLRLVGAG